MTVGHFNLSIAEAHVTTEHLSYVVSLDLLLLLLQDHCLNICSLTNARSKLSLSCIDDELPFLLALIFTPTTCCKELWVFLCPAYKFIDQAELHLEGYCCFSMSRLVVLDPLDYFFLIADREVLSCSELPLCRPVWVKRDLSNVLRRCSLTLWCMSSFIWRNISFRLIFLLLIVLSFLMLE